MLKGKHLIGGAWVGADTEFENTPVSGQPDRFAAGSPELVDLAVREAEGAFDTYAALSRGERAAFLRSIADELETRGSALTEVGMRETALPAARLEGERGRTVGQLQLFADHIEDGAFLDQRHDTALPDRQPLPRPDLRMIQRPVGPVAVFGASNFPLAFSTAGGDTASALAAGCPVVVKGHPAHPGVSDIVAQAILAAIEKSGVPPGVFGQIQDGGPTVGAALVRHPLIRAVGFTGSLGGGRVLFDLCAARPDPIPFFGELGSVNPVFVLDAALAQRGSDIARAWAGSLTMGVGQFCTNPGLLVLPSGPAADAFIDVAKSSLDEVAAQTMLTDGIAAAYQRGSDGVGAEPGVSTLKPGGAEARAARPALFVTNAKTWLSSEVLRGEVFGPLGLVVTVSSPDERLAVARALEGQLTCTLQMDTADDAFAAGLLPILERKAGRILFNGFPTGVEVADAMVHGGPYPASTNFGATSVGTLAVRRFLRPVCYQNAPPDLLPDDLAVSVQP
ncbi:MAG: aldehyde dehydrogenase (NADP(+)) [Pseudomonadota bacterium]